MKAQVYPWRNRGFAYLSVPKAACSSIKWALFEARGVAIPGPHPEWHIHQAPWPEEMLWSRVRQNIQQDGLTAFAVVRHPVQRILSCYVSKLHKDRILDLQGNHPEIMVGMSFVDFVDFICSKPDSELNEHLASQTYLLSDGAGLLPLQLIKIEHLKTQWEAIAKEFNLPTLRRINSSGEYRVKTRQSVVDRIKKRYKADFVNFGY